MSNSQYDSGELLPLLSNMANQQRRRDGAAWTNSNSYAELMERKIVKFWVLPSNCLEVKAEILSNLPQWRHDGEMPRSLENSGSWVSSIYFDQNDWKLYRTRLSQPSDSTLLRWRWYSKERPTTLGFMEQEISQGDCVIKRRFPISSVDCMKFVQAASTYVQILETAAHDGCVAGSQYTEALRNDMFRELHRLGSKFLPKTRTTYRRTVFQEYDGDIRVTFDEDVHLISVSTFEGGLDMDVEQAMNNSFLFPLAVLEVKIGPRCQKKETGSGYRYELPTWCEDLLTRGLITEVQNFSKYLTSVACFHLDEVERMPAWLEATRTMVSIEMLRRNTEIMGSMAHMEIEPPVQLIEPRTYMANERTFLKWTRMCFLAFFLGFSLIGLSVDPKLGLVLAICSVITLFRAYYVYNERLKMIQSSNYKPRFDDRYGPHLLMLLFVIPAVVGIVRYGVKLVDVAQMPA